LRQSLVIHVDVVGRVELAGLVVIDIDMDPVRDRAAHPDTELDVRLQLREQVRVAIELDGRVARAEPGPRAAQVARARDTDAEVGLVGEPARRRGRIGRQCRVRQQQRVGQCRGGRIGGGAGCCRQPRLLQLPARTLVELRLRGQAPLRDVRGERLRRGQCRQRRGTRRGQAQRHVERGRPQRGLACGS
jgi:hypothetical protein